MTKISCKTMFLILVALQLCICDAVMDTKASRLANYDGLSCPQTDVLFLQTDVRSRIECVTRCSGLSDCECVFYKQGYCQGCQGLCHHGHYVNTLPALAGTSTTYYFLNKKPAISSAAGASFDTQYYLIVNNSVTWQIALDHCNSFGATLLYTETGAEFTFIAAHLDYFDYWIGATLFGGQWVWSHSGAPINMSLFAPGRPNGNGTCARMWPNSNFMFNDRGCAMNYYFIFKSF